MDEDRRQQLPKEIVGCLRDALCLVLRKYESFLEDGRIPRRAVDQVSFLSRTGFRMNSIQRPVLTYFHYEISEALLKTSEEKALREAIAANPDIAEQFEKMVWNGECACRLTFDDLCHWIVTKYLIANDYSHEYSESEFQHLCDELADAVVGDTSVIAYRAFLEGVQLEVDSIRLDSSLVLSRIELQEVERLWNTNSWLQLTYPMHYVVGRGLPMNLRTIVELRTEHKKVVIQAQGTNAATPLPQSHSHIERFRRLMCSLRLLQPGRISIGSIWALDHGPASKYDSRTTVESTESSNLIGRYMLNAADAERLKQVWNWQDKRTEASSGHMAIALRRFTRASERQHHYDDIVVDAVVALEAVVLTNIKSKVELRHRFATRIGHLLGSDLTSRKEWSRTAKRAYDLRSSIVHGRPEGVGPEQAEEVLDLCRRCLRRMLWIESKGQQPQWDEWLFMGGPTWSDAPVFKDDQ